jgi:PAS domain S-box-containing protein
MMFQRRLEKRVTVRLGTGHLSHASAELRIGEDLAAEGTFYPMTRSEKPAAQSPQPSTDPESALTMDGDGVVVEWSPQAEAIFGWDRAEAVGKRLSALIIPERQREAHELGLKRFLISRRGALLDRAIEIVMLHRDGREFPVEVRISSAMTNDGWRFPTTARRIDEQK